MKLKLKEFDDFIKNKLRKLLLKEYLNYNIVSEADLQGFAWEYILQFLENNHEKASDFKVLNKPYLKDIKIHPDIIIFRKNIPWIIMELKEAKKLKPLSAQREKGRLIKVKDHFGKSVKRGYLIYVTRYGEGNCIEGPKKDGARFFFEVRISLAELLPDVKEIKDWERNFKKWSKYSVNDFKS